MVRGRNIALEGKLLRATRGVDWSVQRGQLASFAGIRAGLAIVALDGDAQ